MTIVHGGGLCFIIITKDEANQYISKNHFSESKMGLELDGAQHYRSKGRDEHKIPCQLERGPGLRPEGGRTWARAWPPPAVPFFSSPPPYTATGPTDHRRNHTYSI